MSDLNLDLPKSSPPSPRGKGSPPTLQILILLAVVVLIALQFRNAGGPETKIVQVGSHTDNLAFNEDVLLRLEKAGAHGEAARTLSAAIVADGLSDERRAELLARRGRLQNLAGHHEEALGYFYRAEALLGGKPDTELNKEILSTLRRMGRFDAASDELRSLNRRQQGETTNKEDPIVARVDGEELKLGEFRKVVDLVVQQKLLALAGEGVDKGELEVAESEVRQQLATPGERWKILQEWVSSEVLYREALLWKLDSSPDFLDRMENFRRAMLGQLIISQQIEKAQPREQDIENELQAHPEKYGPSANINEWTADIREEALNKTRSDYLKTWRNERQEAFQKDLMERHKVEVFRKVFEEGQP